MALYNKHHGGLHVLETIQSALNINIYQPKHVCHASCTTLSGGLPRPESLLKVRQMVPKLCMEMFAMFLHVGSH